MLAGTPVRWSLAYGGNACPDRLLDKGMDVNGALLLPVLVDGVRPAWEARRSTSTGAVPLTLLAEPGAITSCFALGLHPDDTPVLDRGEGRGSRYLLGRAGPAAVAGRFLLPEVLAFGPGSATRVLGHGGVVATPTTHDQAAAARLLEGPAAVTLAADPLPGTVEGPWPPTPLADLDLFVYGTLQPGGSRWPEIADLVEVAGEATTSGVLTATWYGWPAARFGGDDRGERRGRGQGTGQVHGTLLRPAGREAAAKLYARCDALEDAPRLFHRVAVRVRAGKGRAPGWAAAYQWNPARGAPPGTPVPSGRWEGA